jgi:hypothetical protein
MRQFRNAKQSMLHATRSKRSAAFAGTLRKLRGNYLEHSSLALEALRRIHLADDRTLRTTVANASMA